MQTVYILTTRNFYMNAEISCTHFSLDYWIIVCSRSFLSFTYVSNVDNKQQTPKYDSVTLNKRIILTNRSVIKSGLSQRGELEAKIWEPSPRAVHRKPDGC